MAGIRDFWRFEDDFVGTGASIPTTADPATPWLIADTSAAGAPTYVRGIDTGTSSGTCGEAKVTMEATSEVQNLCLYFGDVLQMDINDRLTYECRLKMGQATLDTATMFAFGLTGDRNATIDTVAQMMIFRVIGDNVLVVESDDGTTDLDDKATGESLTNAYRTFRIDAQDLTNVKFHIDGKRVASTVTFDVSAYAGCLQPFFQIQKTADTNTDSFIVDYIEIVGRRNN